MSKGYVKIVLFIRILYLCSSTSQYSTTCDYICDSTGCVRSIENQNITKEYCASNTSTDVSFSLIETGNETSKFPAIVGLGIKPPTTRCKYEMTLYANEMLEREECTNYEFENSDKEIHSKYSLCFDETQFKNETQVLIPYVFTACYTVLFYFNETYKWMKGNQFLETNYKKANLTEPGIDCVYYPSNHENNSVLRFRMNLTVPVVTEAEVRLIRQNSEDEAIYTSKFDVLNKYLRVENSNAHNKTLIRNYIKNFDSYNISGYETDQYNCKIILRRDIRCWNSSLWKPGAGCIYDTVCRGPSPLNKDNQWSSITYVIAFIFLIITIIYLLCIILFYMKRRKRLYENVQLVPTREPDDPTENTVNRDIVLMYPKGSKKFMTTMTDFRETLSQTCDCTVRDWHNGEEWNYVARIGPSNWFSEMLRNRCRVVWVDVPVTRLLITKKYESRNIEICDFRDTVFPMIFNLSKWDVERTTPSEIKHFIVRFEEFNDFETDDDPFYDLHASMRYSMPQDLELLRSNLSESNNKRGES